LQVELSSVSSSLSEVEIVDAYILSKAKEAIAAQGEKSIQGE